MLSCEETYRQTFHDHKIPIDGVDILMAGRHKQASSLNKIVDLLSYVDGKGFDQIHIFDDDKKNLKEMSKIDYYKIYLYLIEGGKIAEYMANNKRDVL